MRRQWLKNLLLSSLYVVSSVAQALELSSEQVEAWLADTRLQGRSQELLIQLSDNQVDSVKFSLERLAMPQQEVVRYMLMTEIEQAELVLTQQQASLVDLHREMQPSYHVLEVGDGYEFIAPAFNFPATASRIIKRWEVERDTLNLAQQAEHGSLVLRDYLSGDESQVGQREELLIQELPNLSRQALSLLTDQLLEQRLTTWLPSSKVMVSLAQVSQEQGIYDLLWKMRADSNTKQELLRLADMDSEFAYQQTMLAASNPALTEQALRQLARSKPMPEEVRSFLIARMSIEEEAPIVAGELVAQGYRQWLTELVLENRDIRVKEINSILAK
ncbi:hypothetical protein [Vibrio sp. WXL103]|uniref:hypothetical protein n=1 Tax=Vibrio sp. WXL103 TaxID=3450710 RepID=UPI003EC6AD39